MRDLKNGTIEFENRGSVISPLLTLKEFIHSDLYSQVKDKHFNDFSRYNLQPQRFYGNEVNVSLIFNDHNKIFLVNISKSTNNSWDSWSEQREFKRKIEHDKLLEKLIGASYSKYLWGEISSHYDPRSGSSMITIRYY